MHFPKFANSQFNPTLLPVTYPIKPIQDAAALCSQVKTDSNVEGTHPLARS